MMTEAQITNLTNRIRDAKSRGFGPGCVYVPLGSSNYRSNHYTAKGDPQTYDNNFTGDDPVLITQEGEGGIIYKEGRWATLITPAPAGKCRFSVGDWVRVTEEGVNNSGHPNHSREYTLYKGHIGIITKIEPSRLYVDTVSIELNGVSYTGEKYLEHYDIYKLLEEAKKRYPRGTKYRGLSEVGKLTGRDHTVESVVPEVCKNCGIIIQYYSDYVFSFRTNKWAEVVFKEKDKEKDAMRFKIGDRVKCIVTSSDSYGLNMTGMTGTIYKIKKSDDAQPYGVDWDGEEARKRKFQGHNLGGGASYGYWMRDFEIEHSYEPYENSNEIRIGDTVECIEGYDGIIYPGYKGVVISFESSRYGIDWHMSGVKAGHDLAGRLRGTGHPNSGYNVPKTHLKKCVESAVQYVSSDDVIRKGDEVECVSEYSGRIKVGWKAKAYHIIDGDDGVATIGCDWIEAGLGSHRGHNLDGHIKTTTGFYVPKNCLRKIMASSTIQISGKAGRVVLAEKVKPVIIRGEVPRGRILDGRRKKSEIASPRVSAKIISD